MKPFLIAFLLPILAQAESFTGEVVGVSDGDTVTVLRADGKTQEKIRFLGIDAPEKTQEFGALALRLLRKRAVSGGCAELRGGGAKGPGAEARALGGREP